MPEKRFKAAFGDCSKELEDFIKALPDNTTVVFEKGEYYLSRKVRIEAKKGLTLNGNGSIIRVRFDALKGFEDHSGAFGFFGCDDITLCGFIFDTTQPVNSAGEVIAADDKNRTLDVRIFDDCILDGSQCIRAMNSVDRDGSPDYLLSDYGIREYEVLKKGVIRVFCPETQADALRNIKKGTKICFRFGLWNYKTIQNAALTFENCKNSTVEDITVHSSAGGMLVVFPRCENFTLRRYVVKCPENSSRLMASNVDGIHVLGLCGCLEVSDCFFDGLGDDAINIHSTLGTVVSAVGKKITAVNKRFDIRLEKYWCQKGDVIRVYNPDFTEKGSFKAEDYNGTEIIISKASCDISAGDIIANTAFFAETLVQNCEVRNSRARGMLFQTEKVTVKDCRFFGISLPAILFAPDAEFWQEAGPVREAVVEGCRFEKCAFPDTLKKDTVIAARCSHSGKSVSAFPIHKKLIVRNNTFLCDESSSVSAVAVESLEIFENTYIGSADKLE